MSDEQKNEDIKRLLLKANMDLDEMADFEKEQKQAFRIAFDFLKACFPPVRDPEYWTRTIQTVGHKVEDNKGNPLVKHLLLGIYNYLDEIVKDLPEEEETA